MGSSYSGDRIAGYHIHTDITTCNIEEPRQKYRIGPISNRLPGWEGVGVLRHVKTQDFYYTRSSGGSSILVLEDPLLVASLVFPGPKTCMFIFTPQVALQHFLTFTTISLVLLPK